MATVRYLISLMKVRVMATHSLSPLAFDPETEVRGSVTSPMLNLQTGQSLRLLDAECLGQDSNLQDR